MTQFLSTKTMLTSAMVLGLTAAIASPTIAAPTFTPWARVKEMQVGWVVDRMLVFHNTPSLTNPDGCRIIDNGYIISEMDPDRRTSYAMLLSAILNQREVAMVINGCFQERPRIVSVSIR